MRRYSQLDADITMYVKETREGVWGADGGRQLRETTSLNETVDLVLALMRFNQLVPEGEEDKVEGADKLHSLSILGKTLIACLKREEAKRSKQAATKS